MGVNIMWSLTQFTHSVHTCGTVFGNTLPNTIRVVPSGSVSAYVTVYGAECVDLGGDPNG